jgi:hypothetical protein
VLTVGPTKTFDVVMHGIMLVLLVSGLVVTYRARPVPEGHNPVSPARQH